MHRILFNHTTPPSLLQEQNAQMCDPQEYQAADSLTFIPLDPNNPEASSVRNSSGQVDRLRRRTISEEDKANMRIVRAGGACLRCKILKKQVCFASPLG